MHHILVINPGSTSTKLALYEDRNCAWTENISYPSQKINRFKDILGQLPMREQDIRDVIKSKSIEINELSAIAARGGPLKPLESGTYKITSDVVKDIREGKVQTEHVSNLSPLIAYHLAEENNIPAFFVDPVCVDEFELLARFSGLPDLKRRSLLHALSVKAVARMAAEKLGNPLNFFNLVLAHLGGGISICPIKKGRIIDVNNANEEGPFSPERTGTLPVSSLVKLCYSQKYTEIELRKKIVGQGGLTGYLQTNDLREVEKRIESGDKYAKTILEAMAYQIAKEIGAMATVLHGKVDAIVITGGGAYCKLLIEWVIERVRFIAEVQVMPGDFEMEALTLGVLRVLNKEEEAKKY